MDYQNYEDYMRSVLGYNVNDNTDMENNYIRENETIADIDINETEDDEILVNIIELEKMYPEIYKTLDPYITDVCNKRNSQITNEILEDMVEEVYGKIDQTTGVFLNINVTEDRNKEENIDNKGTTNFKNYYRRNYNNSSNLGYVRNEPQKSMYKEQLNRGFEKEDRYRRPTNPLLKDLIKILILNKLIGGNCNNHQCRPPQRPPYPNRPGNFPPPPPGGFYPSPRPRDIN